MSIKGMTTASESWAELSRQDAGGSGAAPWMGLIPDGVLVVDRQGRIVDCNQALSEMCGWSQEALSGQLLVELLPPEVRGHHHRHLQDFFAAPRQRAMGGVAQLALCHRDGHEVPVDISIGSLVHAGQVLALAVVRDVSEAAARHAQERYLALHDELTGLYSRHLFGELLDKALQRCQRSGDSVAVLLIDLDDFKAVNDGHGHQVGDLMLKDMAERMRGQLRKGDALARLGGDEFAVILQDEVNQESVAAVALKLLQALGQPWHSGLHEAYPSASIGLAFAPQDGQDAVTLLRHADVAMYRAKDAGRGTYMPFDADMALQLRDRTLLRGRLQRALESDQGLALHYQPQLDAQSGCVTGVEALLRWTDAELGPVAPDRFIAVAEASGLIHTLGDWVMAQACAQVTAWHEQGLHLQVSVNVSLHQLRQPGFVQRLRHLLQRAGVRPGMLELEITETAAMNQFEASHAVLDELAALGLPLALDDFGKGYSSLAHLRQIPVQRLKMDRSFITQLPGQPSDQVMVRAIIALAKALDKTVVAEGVETQAQRELLQHEGCDTLQGWLFARALPAQDIPEAVAQLNAKAWR
ncbi:putative bifunctional diguanylate cyclase/phosphodiesterase [Roseateles sp. BYS180W]|uniref:Bifunctional diguanylate cyclase/phosphodiesterase n=1 Tax=Roseateles rivi TaxID=3299028 RepID=A0ABW7FTW4_9BURK